MQIFSNILRLEDYGSFFRLSEEKHNLRSDIINKSLSIADNYIDDISKDFPEYLTYRS
jgi:hypothetical protein